MKSISNKSKSTFLKPFALKYLSWIFNHCKNLCCGDDQQKLSYFKCGGRNSEEFVQQLHILRLCSFWTLKLFSKLCSFEALIISSRFICFKNLPALYPLTATKPTYMCHIIILVLGAHSDKDLCYSHVLWDSWLSVHINTVSLNKSSF